MLHANSDLLMTQEAMRFAPVAATGTTRIARQAMMLGGYFIPRWGAFAIKTHACGSIKEHLLSIA